MTGQSLFTKKLMGCIAAVGLIGIPHRINHIISPEESHHPTLLVPSELNCIY